MNQLLSMLATAGDLLLVVLGFSLIIFLHELGHFVAARWAGIRVLAFAIGFGPAVCSYRKGMGWRRGSGEREYVEQLAPGGDGIQRTDPRAVSPTEYRVNWLPLGGYVKMLGQDDLNPGAVSGEPDSYQRCPAWKRMVVISAGVATNLVTAALLFMIVFKLGLQTEPAKVGLAVPGLPASKAVALNGPELGVTEPGLKSGDVITSIDGRRPNSFSDLVLASAMAKRSRPIRLQVQRESVSAPLLFDIVPEQDRLTRFLQVGVEPARSAELFEASDQATRDQFAELMDRLGLPGVRPGMTLESVAGAAARDAHDLREAVRRSGGGPVPVSFVLGDERVNGEITPLPELETDLVRIGPDEIVNHEHLLGLTPVMKVGPLEPADRGYRQGLRSDDVFVRLGSLEFPSITAGIAEIRAHRGEKIAVVVARTGADGTATEISLTPSVDAKGTIGFGPDDTGRDGTLVTVAPAELLPIRTGASAYAPSAAGLIDRPGTRIIAVGPTEVANLGEVREALRAQTRLALGSAQTVELTVEPPMVGPDGSRTRRTLTWTIAPDDIRRLHELSWISPLPLAVFKPEQFLLRASGPVQAIQMGLDETRRVMLSTYVTFARLFEGTVRVEHLKGPVGIAHIGTRIAERGFVWLLFFMALISVNLAVINFLPLPIVDGGQFIFLVVEQIRGKPVPIIVQNVATMAGLLLIGAVFVIVTFNDIANLFGG